MKMGWPVYNLKWCNVIQGCSVLLPLFRSLLLSQNTFHFPF